eukprot:CAMPEP_0204283402 /NCGR_PEP_ID=MMETSP0468-20130131/46028_1 /ASSEMBLY_ACC=CAM_ASM_000383 /TAXON_ID=2969 /ORGANISM="Oxyrrhis marina" /LENGTH=209 /DNA_ID=CAMNT_0051260999 /DNA_START=108 /DNA_END=737 /DNA_ORIENTATION=-
MKLRASGDTGNWASLIVGLLCLTAMGVHAIFVKTKQGMAQRLIDDETQKRSAMAAEKREQELAKERQAEELKQMARDRRTLQVSQSMTGDLSPALSRSQLSNVSSRSRSTSKGKSRPNVHSIKGFPSQPEPSHLPPPYHPERATTLWGPNSTVDLAASCTSVPQVTGAGRSRRGRSRSPHLKSRSASSLSPGPVRTPKDPPVPPGAVPF